MKAYPSITAACQLIALDNGGINRLRSMGDQNIELERWMEDRAQFIYDVKEIEAYLATLSGDTLNELCCGGDDSVIKMGALSMGPEGLDEFLDLYFEEVC